MPAPAGDPDAIARAAKTIAAYLTRGQTAAARSAVAGRPDRGQKLAVKFGCLTCHEPPGETATIPRTAPRLENLAAKWTPQGLVQFLLAPQATRPHGSMPNFALTTKQAGHLTNWMLTRNPTGKPSAAVEPPAAIEPQAETADEEPATEPDVDLESLVKTERALFAVEELAAQWAELGEDREMFATLPAGRRLEAVALRQMIKLGCVNCHVVAPEDVLQVTRHVSGRPTLQVATEPPTGPPLAGMSREQVAGGCLGPRVADGSAPHYALSEASRADLIAYATALPPTAVGSLAERTRIDFELLNCRACHENEGQGGQPLVAILGGAEAARWITPHELTGVATRVRHDRLVEFVRDGARTAAMRPWIGARMPGFAARGARLASALIVRDAAEDLQPAAAGTHEVLASQVELGRLIAGRRGLGCTSCHAFHGVLPEGPIDPTTRAPDLTHIADHLQARYFRRLLADPTRDISRYENAPDRRPRGARSLCPRYGRIPKTCH